MTQPTQQGGFTQNPVAQQGMAHQQMPAEQHQMPQYQQHGGAGGQPESSEHFTVTHTYQHGEAAGYMIRVVSPAGVFTESVGSSEQGEQPAQFHQPHQSSGTSEEGL